MARDLLSARPRRHAAWMRAAVATAALAGVSVLGGPRPAAAATLERQESERLLRGETVVRKETIRQGTRRYVGGVTYTVVDATAADLDALFEDVRSWRKVLPRTQRAELVAPPAPQVAGADRFVEITQGNAFVQASYTLRMRREGDEMRFWMDASLPHDIDDAWGFFRVTPFTTESGEPKVLLTYGILVDVGPGLVRELFEEKVRTAMLSVPQLLRRHVAEQRRAASAR